MKLGKVLSYKDIDEAKTLIGKKVLASNVQALIESDKKCEEEGYPPDYKMIGILCEVNNKYLHPYQCYHQPLIGYQFIREIIEDPSDQSEYELYNLDGASCGKKKKKEESYMPVPIVLEQLSSLESKIREFRSRINKAYRDAESSSEEYDQGMAAAYKRMVLQLDKVLPVRDGEMGFPFLA